MRESRPLRGRLRHLCKFAVGAHVGIDVEPATGGGRTVLVRSADWSPTATDELTGVSGQRPPHVVATVVRARYEPHSQMKARASEQRASFQQRQLPQ